MSVNHAYDPRGITSAAMRLQLYFEILKANKTTEINKSIWRHNGHLIINVYITPSMAYRRRFNFKNSVTRRREN